MLDNSYLQKLRLNTNPILTTLAQGYSQQTLIAKNIYPEVVVSQYPTVRVPIMNTEHMKIKNDKRALYADPILINNGSLGYDDISIEEHSPFYQIDIKELLNDPLINIQKTRTFSLVEGMFLNIEKEVADEVQTIANYTNSNEETLAGTDQWTHASSDPPTQIFDAMEVVRALIGKRPNTMSIGAKSAWALQKNAAMVLAIKGPLGGGQVTIDQISIYFFGVSGRVFVGMATYDNSELLTDAREFIDLWSDNCILSYTSQPGSMERKLYDPSFGYTLKLKGFNPRIKTYPDPNGLKDYVIATMFWKQHMLNNACAYLFTDTNI